MNETTSMPMMGRRVRMTTGAAIHFAFNHRQWLNRDETALIPVSEAERLASLGAVEVLGEPEPLPPPGGRWRTDVIEKEN